MGELTNSRRQELLDTAEAILSGRLGIILGSRRMQAFRFDLRDDLDTDFMTFVGIDSQTDHLPVDDERRNWSEEALVRKDIEIAEAEEFHRTEVVEACRRIIARFAI